MPVPQPGVDGKGPLTAPGRAGGPFRPAGGPFRRAEGPEPAENDRGRIDGAVPAEPARRFTRSTPPCRIWHDGSGNIDLVAWRGSDTLLVEAKGITVRGGRVNGEKAAADVGATLARLVAWGIMHPGVRLGILAPDEQGAEGSVFWPAVIDHWHVLGTHEDRTDIYLVGVDGTVRTPSAQELAAHAM